MHSYLRGLDIVVDKKTMQKFAFYRELGNVVVVKFKYFWNVTLHAFDQIRLQVILLNSITRFIADRHDSSRIYSEKSRHGRQAISQDHLETTA